MNKTKFNTQKTVKKSNKLFENQALTKQTATFPASANKSTVGSVSLAKYSLKFNQKLEAKPTNNNAYLELDPQKPILASCATRQFINPCAASSNPLTAGQLKTLVEKNNNSSRGLQLLDKIEKPINKWPGLMFLHKKGLSHTKPNFNFINYNFPFGAYLNRDEELVTPIYNVNKIHLNNVYKLLVLFFKTMYCIISKPVFIFTQDTIKIQLFYFACIGRNISLRSKKGVELVKDRKRMGIGSAKKVVFNNFFSKLTKVYPNKFKFICAILSKFFNKKVEFDLIRLHKPYYNSEIFVNFLSLIINRKDLSKSIYKLFASKSMNNLLLANINKDNFYFLELRTNSLKDNYCYTTTNDATANAANDANAAKDAKDAKDANAATAATAATQELPNQADNLIIKREKSIKLADKWFGLLEDFYNLNLNLNNDSDNDFIDSLGKNVSPAYLTGMKIKISGRLRREPVIPKVTTKKFEKGFTAKGRINYSEMARFTHKNRKGAFSITIKSGQNY